MKDLDLVLDYCPPVASDRISNKTLSCCLQGCFVSAMVIFTRNAVTGKAISTWLMAGRKPSYNWMLLPAFPAFCLSPLVSDEPFEELAALQAAEKRGEIDDLKEAFGEKRFRKFQEARSIESTFAVGVLAFGVLGAALSASPRHKMKSHESLLSMASFMACAGGLAAIEVYPFLNGGMKARSDLVKLRQNKSPTTYDSSPTSQTIPVTSDKDWWLMTYRKARVAGLSGQADSVTAADSGTHTDQDDEEFDDTLSQRDQTEPKVYSLLTLLVFALSDFSHPTEHLPLYAYIFS